MSYRVAVLECQDCGDVLRKLSTEEARHVAERPENFILWCRACREARGWS